MHLAFPGSNQPGIATHLSTLLNVPHARGEAEEFVENTTPTHVCQGARLWLASRAGYHDLLIVGAIYFIAHT